MKEALSAVSPYDIPQEVNNIYGFLATLAASLFVGLPSASLISQKHPREAYLLWYIFSLFFLVFFALSVAALLSDRQLRDLFGPLAFLYDWLTNRQDELLLVVGIIYLG